MVTHTPLSTTTAPLRMDTPVFPHGYLRSHRHAWTLLLVAYTRYIPRAAAAHLRTRTHTLIAFPFPPADSSQRRTRTPPPYAPGYDGNSTASKAGETDRIIAKKVGVPRFQQTGSPADSRLTAILHHVTRTRGTFRRRLNTRRDACLPLPLCFVCARARVDIRLRNNART